LNWRVEQPQNRSRDLCLSFINSLLVCSLLPKQGFDICVVFVLCFCVISPKKENNFCSVARHLAPMHLRLDKRSVPYLSKFADRNVRLAPPPRGGATFRLSLSSLEVF